MVGWQGCRFTFNEIIGSRTLCNLFHFGSGYGLLDYTALTATAKWDTPLAICQCQAELHPFTGYFLTRLTVLKTSVDCESSFIAVTKYLPCMGPRGERASYTFQRILHQNSPSLAQANQEPPDNRSKICEFGE
ncbi:unnamed protein product [Caretta caretta]